ncbi:hypothetical protein HGM15179_014308 [Zosterops borbonicus]|uniref:Uncharacterized protein n=1 Tax=Zosterops borbonicus TaxID=364589 RepID=A0A8K1LGB3_9PASS|nr:hypothetical protein HGM15179_014308 [Zosterops borbonicus]
MAKRLEVNRPISRWQPVTIGAPKVSASGPALSNILTDHLNKGIECALSHSADDTKLSRILDAYDIGVQEDPQKDLDRLDQKAKDNGVRYNKAQCQGPTLGLQKHHMQLYRFGAA